MNRKSRASIVPVTVNWVICVSLTRCDKLPAVLLTVKAWRPRLVKAANSSVKNKLRISFLELVSIINLQMYTFFVARTMF